MIKIITGPTASGKSGFALELAAKQKFSIVNADALQLYKGLPLLTACPSAADKERVPHFLYETVDPFHSWTVVDWLKKVQEIIEEEDGKVLIVGGSGFYIKALTEGLSPLPDIPPEIREKLMHRLNDQGLDPLYQELRLHDPELAAKFESNDRQRILRALEVFHATGKKLSVWQQEPKVKLPFDFEIELIMPKRETLYENCNARFLKMIDQGIVNEARNFLKTTNDQDNALKKALGFKELRSYLKGEIELTRAIELAQTATRQFAKRQMTWFRWQL